MSPRSIAPLAAAVLLASVTLAGCSGDDGVGEVPVTPTRTASDGVSPSGEATGTNDQICDLSHSSCSLLVGDKPLTASIEGLPIRPEHDFVLRLQGGSPAITPTKAWLEGKTMFMGVIPVQLEAKDGGWQGAAQLGSCTTETMEWLLNIEWSNGQRQQLTLGISP